MRVMYICSKPCCDVLPDYYDYAIQLMCDPPSAKVNANFLCCVLQ